MSAIQDYLDSLSNDRPLASVAGPKGLLPAWEENKQSDAMQSYMNGLGGSFAQSGQQLTGAPTPNFRNWYTGANTGGTQNGWDTQFQQVFQSGIRSAQEKGDPYGYFAQPKATGVVTWDNAAGAGKTKFTFGDVVVDGAKVANVYTDFDRHTANVMMGEYLIQTGSRKAELNKAGDIPKAWDEELTQLRSQANTAAEVAPRAKEFNANVEAEVKTDADRPGIVAGGAASGALLGAGLASVVPVLGTAVGAVAGGLIGGIGAWLNSDSLAYQLARSQEQVKLASAESAAAGAQAWGSLIAQNTMSIGMSPLSNLLHGSYDLAVGKGVGGGAIGGAFEETNKLGERKASGLVQALGFGSMIADSFLQFASPAGKLAYQAQMSVQIGAGVSGLLPGVGAWDQTTLKQNSIWTSDELNPTTGKVEQKFDIGNALAGIGNVGIDVVQLGAISSLSRGVDRLAAQTRAATGIEGAVAKPFRGDRPWERLNLSGAQREALKSGGTLETRSGYKFVKDEAGEIVGKARGTLAMLAPSEGLQALSTKMLARRDVARRNGAVTAEELYQAASDLALGQRGLTAMLVNAVGEGQEEVIQAILEPMSQDHKIDAESVMRAGLAGAAAGFGMTAGARLGRPNLDQQMYAAAMVGHAAQTGGDVLTYKTWQGMDQLAKRTLVKSAGGLNQSLTAGAFAKIERDRINGTIGGVVEAAALEDYYRDEQKAALVSGAKATDQASPIVMHESATYRPEAITTSASQLLTNQMDRTHGAVLQLDELDAAVGKAQADSATAPEALAKLLSDQVSLQGVVRASQTLERTIAASVKIIEEAYTAKDTLGAEAEIDVLNDTLEAMFDMSDDTYDLVVADGSTQTVTLADDTMFSFSKAVSRLMTRDPADSTGSWQVLLPQVNKTWAFRGADGIYGISQVILQSIRGDYDGDKIRLLQQLIVDDARYVNLRSGANILGASVMPDIGSSKFEKLLSVRVMQSWNSRNVPLREAARRVAREIERSLFTRYNNRAQNRTPISSAVIQEVTLAAQDALQNGKDVRETVLELMSRRAGNALTQIGRGELTSVGSAKLSNEMYWISGEITRHMAEFQSAWARYTPVKGDSVLALKSVTAPAKTSTEAASTKPLRGATESATMIEELPGSNLFRMFQKLHYTLWETTEKFAGWATDAKKGEYQQLVQLYESLSQGVNVQRNERMSPSDRIIGDVMGWLEAMAADPAELERLGMTSKGDMALIANAAVPQMLFARDESNNLRMKYTGHDITIGQHLLYLALHKFQQENKNVWDRDVDLKAAYNNLIRLTKPQTQGDRNSVSDNAYRGNAEMAFVTIFEGVRNYDLVGVDAVSLGVNRTVGQSYRQLMSDSPIERNEQKYALRAGAPYADSEKGVTIPFSPKELGRGSVTAYKALVDSLFSAADSSISMNLTGNNIGETKGRLAKKSNNRGEAIQKAYTSVQALLRVLEPKSGPYTAADISRIANSNREFGDMLMKTIPPSAMPFVFKRYDENGRVVFASWFYEVWTQPSAEQAEMSYFRNLITNTWFAKKLELDSTADKKISFHRLDSRIHRVMFNLASRSVVDSTPLKAFMTKLNEAQSVKEFMVYMNTTEYLGAEGAPLLAWVDDVAEFDPERAGGGWSSQLSTPSLMEHINNLQKTASRMVTDLDKADERSTKDIQTAMAIQRWHKHLKDPSNQNLTALTGRNDEAQYMRFQALLEKAARRRMANGPRAMLQHTAHLVYGIYGPAHAKGVHPPQMAANAALEALDNAFGYLITAERLAGDLTTHNEESVSQSPQMVLRDGGRTMTRDGAQVEWDLNAVEAMLPLMLNKENHSLMRSVLFDTVVELDTDDVARRKFLMGSTLDDVMSNKTVKDLFNDKKNPNLTQSMKFLVNMEQILRDTQKHQLEQKVTEMVLAWTTGLDQPASFEEIQSMTVQAYMVMASILQVVGRTQKQPGQEDPAVLAGRVLKESSMVAAIASAYKVDVEIVDKSMSNMQALIQDELLKPYRERVSRLLDQSEESGLSVTARDAILKQMQIEVKVQEAMQAKIDRMFDLNVTEAIVNQFFYSTEATEPEKDQRQTELMEYVYEHGELMQAAGPALITVQAIKNHFGERARDQKVRPLQLPDETWEELSNVIISMEIQHLLTVGPASKPPPPYPAALKPGVVGLNKRKFWDHSFSYLYDFLDEDATDGIVAAARQLAVEGGKVMAQFDETDIINKVRTTMLREGMIGQWTPEIPIQSVESYELLMGASAIPSISMHGLLSQRWGATAKATRRQFADTIADALVTLSSEDLNWTETGMFHDVLVTAGNGVTRPRPLAMMNNRFAEELSFSYLDPGTGARVTDIDLMRYPNAARQWAGPEGASSRFREVNILRLIEELERILKANHPESSDGDIQMLLRGVSVTMKFVDPDAQPATDNLGAIHANSLWHEGAVYASDGDVGESLIQALFFGEGGLNPRGQQAGLDTRKLGLSGIEDYERPRFEDVQTMEAEASLDFARMLVLKTNVLMDTAISDGKPIDIQFYNAAYKLMKLKHWVEGIDKTSGEKTRWSAEQVIEWQMAHPGTDFFEDQGAPLEYAKLWLPSDQVLADMMGDIGYGGVRGRALKRGVTVDLDSIPMYISRWSQEMERKFSVENNANPKFLTDTDVARQSYVQDLKVSSFVTPQERTLFQRRVEDMGIRIARAQEDRTQDAQRKTFDPVKNRETNIRTALGFVSKRDIDVAFPPGFEFLEAETGDLTNKAKGSLQAYTDWRRSQVGNNSTSFWIYQEEGMSSVEDGRLIKSDLGGRLKIVPGEVVFFDVAGYRNMDPAKAREKALTRIEYFVNQGAALMLGSSQGADGLIAELQYEVQAAHGYQRYEGDSTILVPDVFDESSFQNVAAARSRLVAPSAVQIDRQSLSFLMLDQHIEENTMWVPIRPGRKTKFDAVQQVFDLLPTDVHAQFNTPNTSDDAQMVMRWLEGLQGAGVEMLRAESLRHLFQVEKDGKVKTELKQGVTQEQVDTETREFNESWDNLMKAMPARVAANTTLPQIGETNIGFIPLLNTATGEMLLYRHGYSYPQRLDYQRQLRNQTPGDTGERGIVMYSGERQPSATTHSKATVIAIVPSPGRGLRMEMEIPVQELGSKIVYEHNGMKYLKTNVPANFSAPVNPLFGDIEIDGFASANDVISKEATDGLVTSFQQAFTVFGIDFKADIQDFFGTQTADQAVRILRQIAALGGKQSVEKVYQYQSILAGQDAYVSAIVGLLPTLQQSNIDVGGWADKLQDTSAQAVIARAMIVYLMSPNADVNAILASSGFYVDNPSLPGALSQKMPELFTRAFDLSAPDSVIRTELSRRINKEKLNSGYHLDVNSWELEIQVPDGNTLRGMLQYGEAHVSEDNVLLNLMAQERKDNQSATVHQGLMNMLGPGGVLRPTNERAKKKLARLDEMRRQDLPKEAEAGSLWRDLTFVDPQTYGPGSRWQTRTPAEYKFYQLSLSRMKLYRQRLDLEGEALSKDAQTLSEIKSAITAIVDRLQLRPSDEELVHYWIRQVLYHPAEGSDQDAFSGDLSPNDVLGATRTILDNIEDGYLPTYDGAGPSFFAYSDLHRLFQASQRNENGWRPSRKEGDRNSLANRDDLGDWIAIAFGQAINEKVEFDPIYRVDFSGFMNTYQTVLRNSGYMMDITFDKEYQGRLLDPKTNELLSVTFDPVQENRLQQQQIMAIANLEYEDLMSGATTADSVAWRSRRIAARARWRSRHKVRPVKVQSARDFGRNGTEVINRDADMHSLQRIVVALRHGTAMLNPGLYFSMVPEQGFRMMLSELTNTLTGESTMASVSGAQRGVEALVSRASGGRVNMQLAQYSAEQVKDLNELFKTMGKDGAFTSLIIGDMMWKKNEASPGKVVDAFERYASLGNKWQDPTWGTTQRSLARHYIEAIIREIEAAPTRNVMTIDSVISNLRTDPAYFAKHHKEMHLRASNFVVDFRSLKNTPWSLAMKGMYEPWAMSESMGKRFVGTLIKLQGMYATYNMNVLTTITGMQGYTAMAAAFADGKQKPGSFMKLWFKARNGEPITDDDYETFDMSTVIDGVTIANAFIRGGVTQTGLFMLGMAAGGVLSGEDDEAKRRRRLAQAQGSHLIMDPRRLETDFRNKDALFLDWMPPQLSAFFKVQGDDGSQGARAVVQVSWIMKQFLSPILGMERFFMTGDFDYVRAGFSDAVSSLPLFNKGRWDDVVRTAHELEALAADEQAVGTPTATKNSMYLLTSAVGLYEGMLVENMFVNSLYTGFDMYDRDPSRLVLRDSDGDPQKTIENDSRPNDVALTNYIGKYDGEVGQGYMKRDPLTGNIAAYAENNFTAAAVMSLFTGFKKDYLRSEMPVRTRTIKMPELSDSEAKIAVILATLNSQNAQGSLERRLSLDEVTGALKGKFLSNKDWDSYNNLDALAMQFYKSSANPVDDPLSRIGRDGYETLTKSGHVALFKGLMGGTISLDDPQIRGIAITVDMRKDLEKDFFRDITREGVDIGLTLSQAESRAKRLMLGPMDDPSIIGFRDILWDKRIPWTPDAKYKQLNTTYVQGPDGFPWATGFKRGGAPGMGGIWQTLGGVKKPTVGMTDAITQDGRMNSVDQVRGIDTGQRGLVPFNETELIPTDWEQTQKIIEALKDPNNSPNSYVPNSKGGGSSGGGGGGFYRGSSGGGYSSKGYSPTIYWSRQPTLPRGTNVYGNTARNLFWNNANIRRTTIRRERYQSTRGRLMQWQ